MTSAVVSLTVHDAVATVALTAATRRNALTAEMVTGIDAAFVAAEAHRDVRVVVVTGSGRAFCAGADLKTLERSAQNQFASVKAVYAGFLRVLESPLPTIAAVNGSAVGAGLNLALACDVRIAATTARFDTRFGALRLHPGGGHTWLLQHAVGYETAVRAILFGEVWDATRAHELGLVSEVTEPENLLPTAIALGNRLAGMDKTFACRLIATLRKARGPVSHSEVLLLESENQEWSVGEPAFVENVRALRAAVSGRSEALGPTAG